MTQQLKRQWTGERVARLGFLLGLGWDAKRVAVDPIIASTPNNVHRQAQRFGLSFRAAHTLSLGLSALALRRFENAAARRGLTCEALAQLLLREVANDSHLIDNILDDQHEVAAGD
jgi:hypothetical protein